jgi:hypothetical protein
MEMLLSPWLPEANRTALLREREKGGLNSVNSTIISLCGGNGYCHSSITYRKASRSLLPSAMSARHIVRVLVRTLQVAVFNNTLRRSTYTRPEIWKQNEWTAREYLTGDVGVISLFITGNQIREKFTENIGESCRDSNWLCSEQAYYCIT